MNCLFLFLIVNFHYTTSYAYQPLPEPRNYIAYKTSNGSIKIDGDLNEEAWDEVEWTDLFLDIEGSVKPKPRFNTRVKMRYDDSNLYIGAYLEEPHVCAFLTEKNSVIYHDNDFEIFVDPDWSSHQYTEFEINAFNTIWGLLIINPYRDSYNIINPYPFDKLKTAVKIYGTINDPSDIDEGWSIEIALPWETLRQFAGEAKRGVFNKINPPSNGDIWRINFSRVEWQYDIIDNKYVKKLCPEDNWVWSPQYEINMHKPESFGFVQFSDSMVNKDKFVFPETRWNIQNVLFWIYKAQKNYFIKYNKYATSFQELDLSERDIPKNIKLHKIDLDLVYNYKALIIALNNVGFEIWEIRGDSRQSVKYRDGDFGNLNLKIDL